MWPTQTLLLCGLMVVFALLEVSEQAEQADHFWPSGHVRRWPVVASSSFPSPSSSSSCATPASSAVPLSSRSSCDCCGSPSEMLSASGPDSHEENAHDAVESSPCAQQKKLNVVVGVVTTLKYHETRANAVKQTWARRDGHAGAQVLFLSETACTSLPAVRLSPGRGGAQGSSDYQSVIWKVWCGCCSCLVWLA
jgi:hypothetical protein